MDKAKNYKLYCHEFVLTPQENDGWGLNDLCFRLREFISKTFDLKNNNYRETEKPSICIVHENENKIDEIGRFFDYLVGTNILSNLEKSYFTDEVQYNHILFNQDLDLAYKGFQSLKLSEEINSELNNKNKEHKAKIKI